MKFRIAVVLGTGLMLSGCSLPDFHMGDLLDFSSNEADAGATAQPSPATQATAQAETPSVFCRNVAMQDASGNAFDAATQQSVAQKSYAQCVALFGSN